MAGPLEKNFKIQPKRLKSMTHFQTGQFKKKWNDYLWSDVIAGDDLSIDIPKLRGINIYWTFWAHYLSVDFFFFRLASHFLSRDWESFSLPSSSNNSSTVFCPVSWIILKHFLDEVIHHSSGHEILKKKKLLPARFSQFSKKQVQLVF